MRYPILSFAAGEVTPQVDARSDADQYAAACRTLQNMLPRVYGSAERRPGTRYIETVNSAGRVIPFIYSNDIAYIVLMDQGHMYFYYDGAEVLDGSGNRLEVSTPYTSLQLPQIQYKQSNDVMRLVHPDNAPYKLERDSATSFSLSAITFTGGPFLPRNDIANDDGVTMTPSVTTGSGTLTASSATFDVTHVGALFSVTQPRAATTVGGSATSTGVLDSALLISGAFTFTTHGIWTGTVVLQRSVDGSTWENYRTWSSANDRFVQYAGTEKEDSAYYRINVTVITSGRIHAELSINDSTQTGICAVSGFVSSTVVNMVVRKTFASTNADLRWSEGCWSGYRGYPATCSFFDNRAVYGATAHQPQTLWFSASDDYDNFTEGVNDDDAFYLTLSSDERNAIQWITPATALIVGTTGGHWRVRASSPDAPLTPSNYAARPQTSHSCAPIQAIPIHHAILSVDKHGRKVREITYDWNRDRYIAPDLAMLAEHITEGGIIAMAFQASPDPTLWMVLATGTLLSMTYDSDKQMFAWAKHPMRTGDTVESVACIPGDGEDEVWIITQRVVGGMTPRFLEQMQPRSVTDQEDQWFVDCGLGYDSAAATVFTGLDHINGQEVAILADGGVEPNQLVQGGQVTLTAAASRVIVGLPYRYILKPMRLDYAVEGTTKGTIKRVAEVVVSFLRTLNTEYGTDEDNLFQIDWRTEEAYGSAPALYTGDKVVSHDGGFGVEDDFIVTGDGPVPCTVRAMIPRVKALGR